MWSSLEPLLCFHLRLFHCAGFQPLPQTRRSHCVSMVWTSLLLAAFCALTVHTYLSEDEYLYRGDRFGYFNDVLKVCTSQLALTIVFVETIIRRPQMLDFWRQYARLKRSDGEPKQSKTAATTWLKQWYTYSRFLGFFYSIFGGDAVLQTSFFATTKDHHLKLFWSMFLPYIAMVRLRHMQYILHMECVRLQLQQLERELGLLADYTNFAERIVAFEGFEEFIRRKLLQLQRHYDRIYDMFWNCHQAFAFSVPAVLLMQYVRVLVDSYFIFYNQYRNVDGLERILLIPALFEIPMLLLTSMNCMNAVKYITHKLHSIKHSPDNVRLSVQIQNFSLQILHQKIHIDAVGISVMDGYMLTRVIGSITTYMIFFIQFMPKFQKL